MCHVAFASGGIVDDSVQVSVSVHAGFVDDRRGDVHGRVRRNHLVVGSAAHSYSVLP